MEKTMPKVASVQYVIPDHCGNEPSPGKKYIPCARTNTSHEACMRCIYFTGERDEDIIVEFNPLRQYGYIPREDNSIKVKITPHFNGAIGCGPQCPKCAGNSLTCACEEETTTKPRIPKPHEEGGSCEFASINHEALKENENEKTSQN